MWRLALLGSLVLINAGCFRQVEEPANKPDLVIEHPDSTLTVILDGYRSGDERRAFQEILKAHSQSVENLNAGAQHAEYAFVPPLNQPDWLTQLRAKLELNYTFRQEADRLYFVRKP